MKTATKILICLLAFCMILPFMASCNKNNSTGGVQYQTPPPNEEEQTTPAGGANNGNGNGGAVEETTTSPDDLLDMPEIVDMGGYTYKAYVRKYAGSDTIDDQMANGNNRFFC